MTIGCVWKLFQLLGITNPSPVIFAILAQPSKPAFSLNGSRGGSECHWDSGGIE